jgi:hypothetical protein
MVRQRLTIRWLNEGGAITNFFNLPANHHRWTSRIISIDVDGVELVAKDDKAKCCLLLSDAILGSNFDHSWALDFERLGLLKLDLSLLGRLFTEDENWEVIRNMPLDKAWCVHWSLLRHNFSYYQSWCDSSFWCALRHGLSKLPPP